MKITCISVAVLLFCSSLFSAEGLEDRVKELESHVASLERRIKTLEKTYTLGKEDEDEDEEKGEEDSKYNIVNELDKPSGLEQEISYKEVKVQDFLSKCLDYEDIRTNREITALRKDLELQKLIDFMTQSEMYIKTKLINASLLKSGTYSVTFESKFDVNNKVVYYRFYSKTDDDKIIKMNIGDSAEVICQYGIPNKPAYQILHRENGIRIHNIHPDKIMLDDINKRKEIVKQERQNQQEEKPKREIKPAKWIAHLESGGKIKVAEKEELEDANGNSTGEYKMTDPNGISTIIHRSKFIVEDIETGNKYKYNEKENRFLKVLSKE